MLSQQKPNETLEEIWGRASAVAAQCAKQSTGNKDAEFLGTVALVRDTMQVVDALAEDGLLRYWGEFPPVSLPEFIPRQRVKVRET